MSHLIIPVHICTERIKNLIVNLPSSKYYTQVTSIMCMNTLCGNVAFLCLVLLVTYSFQTNQSSIYCIVGEYESTQGGVLEGPQESNCLSCFQPLN